jgi:hypothetical protein
LNADEQIIAWGGAGLDTLSGVENLTAGTPKTIEEVERTCAEAPRLPR